MARKRKNVRLFFETLEARQLLSVFADFNGGGFGDLAVGASGQDVGSAFSAGAVNVIYGSSAGLTSAGNQVWTQDSAGIADATETNDYFGSALAAGDFDGDG